MELTKNQQNWIKKNISDDISPHTRYQFDITLQLEEGDVVNNINFDLVWYILIQFEGDDSLRLAIAQRILQDKAYLQAFKDCTQQSEAKRVVEEFLIFNQQFLIGLKKFIDFTVLDEPVNFITHALFVKYREEADSNDINIKRAANVRAVLSTGYKLPNDSKVREDNAEFRKILTMAPFTDQFQLLHALLDANFSLFGGDLVSNREVAVAIIKARQHPGADKIIRDYSEHFQSLEVQVPGTDAAGNLADYFYWVQEDMQVVEYLKTAIGMQLTQAG